MKDLPYSDSRLKTKLVSPSWLNLLIPLSIAAHFILPIQMLFDSPVRLLGMILILGGIALNLAASASMRGSRTSVEFGYTPTRLVATGPFQISRNPIYLGGIVALLGIAILLGSLVTFLFPVLLFLILHLVYVPIEEKEMEALFGTEYIDYKRKVRRWL